MDVKVICVYADGSDEVGEIIKRSFCLFLKRELRNLGLVVRGSYHV